MKVNLRKADALARKLKEAVTGIEIEKNVTFSVYDTITAEALKAKIQSARNALTERLDYRQALLGAIMEIRYKIGVANVEVGIHKLLTNRAYLMDASRPLEGGPTSRYLGRVATSDALAFDEVPDVDRLMGRLILNQGLVKEGKGTPEVTIILEPPAPPNHKADLLKVMDELTAINYKTEIELSEETVQTLKRAELI